MNDSTARTVVKTVSWRIMGSGATFLISFFMTGNFAIAGTIAGIQIVANTVLYYIHERLWNKLSWGKT